MNPAPLLRERVRRDIQSRTDKVLRELGSPEPPLRLEDVRELLRLDRDYFTSDADGLLQSFVSKLKRGGKQILERRTLLIEAVKKFDLRALYLPDRKRILLDDSIPKPKHRWLEAHEIGHDLLPWHHDMMLGDDDITPTAFAHQKMEIEANYAAGSLLFLGERFRDECLQVAPSIANARVLKKRYGNSITTTLWRIVEFNGKTRPILGAIGSHPSQHPHDQPRFRHLIPSQSFTECFEVPCLDDLMNSIRGYCGNRRRGPLGAGEVLLLDRSERRHIFDFETFFNGHDALTLGVHRCQLQPLVAVGLTGLPKLLQAR